MFGNDSVRFGSFLRQTQFTLFGYNMYISPTNTPWTMEEPINFRNSRTGGGQSVIWPNEMSKNDSTHFGSFFHQTRFQPKSYTLTLTSITIF